MVRFILFEAEPQNWQRGEIMLKYGGTPQKPGFFKKPGF
jgi:hypothetical protein